MDVCGVDWPERAERFDVVYNLLSVSLNQRRAGDRHDRRDDAGAVGVRRLAGGDLVGARGLGPVRHRVRRQPDLRRILTDYGFEGHPLRKDFPLTGYVEVRYDEDRKQVVYEPVQADAGLPQLRFPLAVGGDDHVAGRRKGARERAERGRDEDDRSERTESDHGQDRRDRQPRDQFRPAASGRAWRAAADPGDGRRGGRARRPAYRTAASRHRKADRVQDLHAGGAVFRPARLCLADVRRSMPSRWRPRSCWASTAPERAQWIRVLFAEITRVLNHLLNVTTFALDVGAITPALWGFEEREKLMEFHEAASGRAAACQLFSSGRRGEGSAGRADGRRSPPGPRRFPKFIDDLEELLTDNRIWKQRTVDIGVISAEQALAWGFSGPPLRASGVPWDLRRAQPYDKYDRGRFRGPGRRATATATTAISSACAEMRESVKIIRQCLEQDEAGPGEGAGPQIHAADARRDEALDGSADPSLQALYRGLSRAGGRHLHGGRRRRRASSACIWSPTAPTGRIAARSARPALRFCRRWTCCAKRHMLADVCAIIGSLDVVFGEIDR